MARCAGGLGKARWSKCVANEATWRCKRSRSASCRAQIRPQPKRAAAAAQGAVCLAAGWGSTSGALAGGLVPGRVCMSQLDASAPRACEARCVRSVHPTGRAFRTQHHGHSGAKWTIMTRPCSSRWLVREAGGMPGPCASRRPAQRKVCPGGGAAAASSALSTWLTRRRRKGKQGSSHEAPRDAATRPCLQCCRPAERLQAGLLGPALNARPFHTAPWQDARRPQ